MRNVGHQAAATAGLALARGSRVMLIDADLQDPPELIGLLVELLDKGAREAETWFTRTTVRSDRHGYPMAYAGLHSAILLCR
jgi:glycosyltransferase involved in cell wall biosynthesis